MTAEQQTDVLAKYIMAEIPGEPSHNEGAGNTAVRVLKQYRRALGQIMDEIGEPQPDYPTPVFNAWKIAKKALSGPRNI